ncbi:MAG: D-cysteine desulfhydrase family protein [Thermomicrobiales bacterium]
MGNVEGLAALEAIPRFPLCLLPTPLDRAPRLEAALGTNTPRIWIKRDDLTGLAFGGNKARKLEYLMADALAQRATVVVTEGNTQSNHARMTAAAAVLAGLRAELVLDPRAGLDMQGNLLLDRMMGAEIHILEPGDARHAAMLRIADELRKSGERPYVIRVGGSTSLGALGYARAMVELAGQMASMEIEADRIYSPTGSQGTLAGLVVGATLVGREGLIQAIAVEDHAEMLAADAAPIATGAASLLAIDRQYSPAEFAIDDDYVGEGYCVATPSGLEAIGLLARTEALFLEPTYSGKAMSGLIGHIREGRFSPEDDVVFIHTGGGPAVFARAAELSTV